MTDKEKLETLQTLLDDGGALPSEDKLTKYLKLAGKEILNWMYHLVGGVPENVESVPERYEVTQIYAVVAGYTHAGAEGQTAHDENGIRRTFKYTDMLDYIHNNVLAFVRVGAVSTS
jgi:hypothetical protein